MKRLVLVVLAALGALGLAACGEKKDVLSSPPGSTQPLSLMLDWVPNADHVGIYQALSEGDFTKAGIDVHVSVPGDPATPLELLAAGKVDVAISYEPEVLLARDRGLPLVSIGAIVQSPLTSVLSLPSKHNHIRTPADLRGKRVGDAGIPYQHTYLTTILARAHVPVNKVKEINVGTNLVPAMISGRVDATLGGYWNYEAIQLAQRGKHPKVIHMESVGVPTYDELVLVVRRDTITQKTDLLRRFVQALGRGYQAVRRDPAEGVASLVHANPGLDQKLQAASVRATLPVFFPSVAGKPWGWQDPTQWNAYGQWMLTNHLISKPSAAADASTNELLAGQGI
jgi:putative hydroxymethylpyrimidine transport system substrate-binding protein